MPSRFDINQPGALVALIVVVSVVGIAWFFYMLPYYIGRMRGITAERSVFWLNLLLGWWVFPWLVLIWYSLTSQTKEQAELLKAKTAFYMSRADETRVFHRMPISRLSGED